ncbi:hypothetical protein D5R81_15735 [Parashewanella spongiae]|uniref:Uncharacterized protein n=1 Tax=Parashewanella spongiae TaxID=342950 RepID=A0A3A6T7C5_9GAMM|nr:hypothetical protein [Parashewanella spongiae]MCL1080027.1 hypothetical protein [Parashewanella spongiae]RJY07453.1 hypothetical protein D5R81_15735 [Parashewanella spongiae]
MKKILLLLIALSFCSSAAMHKGKDIDNHTYTCSGQATGISGQTGDLEVLQTVKVAQCVFKDNLMIISYPSSAGFPTSSTLISINVDNPIFGETGTGFEEWEDIVWMINVDFGSAINNNFNQ